MCSGKVIYVTVVGHFKVRITVLSKSVEGYLLSGETPPRDHNSHYVVLIKIMLLDIMHIQNMFNNSVSAIQFNAEQWAQNNCMLHLKELWLMK
jgi:hypothetical protein